MMLQRKRKKVILQRKPRNQRKLQRKAEVKGKEQDEAKGPDEIASERKEGQTDEKATRKERARKKLEFSCYLDGKGKGKKVVPEE